MLQADTEAQASRAYSNGAHDNGLSASTHPGDTVFGIVHDLGNLIQIAASALNIISRSSDMEADPALRPVLDSANASLRRAGSLVQNTLRFARDGQSANEPVDVWACLVEIQALVHATWEHNIAFELYTSHPLPVLSCSRVGLLSALMNLLINARDAMPNGGTISLVAGAVYGAGATEIELRVSDNGLGMTREVLHRASDPFFTTKVSGLGGLGLPMVNRFAQEIGGRLHLESEPGRGTVATLWLPVGHGNSPAASGYVDA